MAASLRRMLDPLWIGGGAERGDVLGDRAGEQPVVLQDAADLRAVMLEPDRLHGHIVQQHGAAARPQQAGEDLEQGRLARARGPDDRDALAGRDVEIEVSDDRRLVVAVAEADAPRAQRRLAAGR